MDTGRKPLLAYDGRCEFCLLWVERWRHATGDAVDYAPASEVSSRRPGIPAADFAKSVVLIRPDGGYETGARAALAALGGTAGGRRLLALYEKLPWFANAAERAYRFVAGHRDEMLLLTRVLWGRSTVPPGYAATAWIFLRVLALVYAVSFVSAFVQLPGLVGRNGILPVEMLLDAVHARAGAAGPLYVPTLAWLDPGDGFLLGLCVAGAASAMMLLFGVLPRFAAASCWLTGLSVVVAGQEFFRFQWDALLLEAGFLAIFLAPGGILRTGPGDRQPSRAVRWLLWLLLFRLMFMSGVVKLTAGDISWWNLSALTFHYQTQPLPTPLAWYAHHLPAWFHALSAFLMFCIEIGAPLLFFAPRRARHLGAILVIVLQVLIALTGNFAFFNLLAVALCLSLFDDGVTGRFVPRFLRGRPQAGGAAGTSSGGVAAAAGPRRFPSGAPGIAALLVMLALNFHQLAGLFLPRSWRPEAIATTSAWASHFRIVNGYGLFRVMTVKRPEIVIEGSDDRKEWREYGFRDKPGDPARVPSWTAPHQPRLDWQLWFAALGSARDNEWLTNLAIRILEGSPEALRLLGDDPFGGRPPRYVRVLLYEYRFTTPAERDSTGALWTRSFNSLYLAPISLEGN